MKSLIRFLIFVVVLCFSLAALYLWRSAQPSVRPVETTSAPATSERTAPPLTSRWPGLEAMDREFTSLVRSVMPSVVSINAIPADAGGGRAAVLRQLLGGAPGVRPPPQLGSGAIVSEDGFIVTNLHVVNQASLIEVQLSDGRSLPAQLVGADPGSDVAVLKVSATGLSAMPFAESDDIEVGQMVFAIGNPFGLQETVTRGIISAKGRRTMSESTNEFFQTDAPINPGNSGGPLVDLRGQLVGLNNHILPGRDGIGFAIPSNTVRRVFENIRDNGRFVRPWFGVVMSPLSPALAAQLGIRNPSGAFIREVVDRSPAARAGVQPGDLITSFRGKPVESWRDLRNFIADSEPGQQVTLGVRRENREMELKTTIDRQPGD
jgi:serine protease Do